MIPPDARWHCPRDTDDPPWCTDNPCPGHESDETQRVVAQVLAWVGGHDGIPEGRTDAYLAAAHRAMWDIGEQL